MSTDLQLAPDLTLPLEAVTAAIGVLGVRGSGKTTTASVLAEEIIGSGCQAAIIDPLDAWWGLRTDAAGDAAGLPVVVFGGDRGDLPLEPGMATAIANLIVEQGISAVLSLRHLSKAKQRHLVAEFAEQLYHRKGEAKHRRPLHVVVDEADAFVPQHVRGDVARAMGAIDDLVRRGRSSGFGVTLITQRAAAINKDVLSQIDILVAHRTVSPQDRKALEAWIDAHDSEGRKAAFMESLASLGVGEAWVWSPSLLDLFARVQIRHRRTFDSSATPKVGQARVEPTATATIDLELLRDQLAGVVEQAEENDPVALKRQVIELRRQLAERPVERVEIPVEVPVERGGLAREAVQEIEASLQRITQSARCVMAMVARASGLTEPFSADASMPAETVVEESPAPTPARSQADLNRPPVTTLREPFRRVETLPVALKAGERRILDVLARHYPMRVTKAQLGTLADLTMTGGSAQTYYRRLLTGEWIVEHNDLVSITPLGFATLDLPVPDAPISAAEVRQVWIDALPSRPAQMLQELIAVWPKGLSKAELADRLGMTASGGSFNSYIGTLRQNGLVMMPDRVRIQASDDLFREGDR